MMLKAVSSMMSYWPGVKLRRLIRDASDCGIDLIGECVDVEDVLELSGERQIDVLSLDVQLLGETVSWRCENGWVNCRW